MKRMKMLDYSDKELVDGGMRLQWVESVPWEEHDSEMSCGVSDADDDDDDDDDDRKKMKIVKGGNNNEMNIREKYKSLIIWETEEDIASYRKKLKIIKGGNNSLSDEHKEDIHILFQSPWTC